VICTRQRRRSAFGASVWITSSRGGSAETAGINPPGHEPSAHPRHALHRGALGEQLQADGTEGVRSPLSLARLFNPGHLSGIGSTAQQGTQAVAFGAGSLQRHRRVLIERDDAGLAPVAPYLGPRDLPIHAMH
jgi:hypothetical protein